MAEGLTIDFAVLLRAAIPDLGEAAIALVKQQSATDISKRMRLVGELCWDRLGIAALKHMQTHLSDTVRGWACFMVGARRDMTIPERLLAIRPFADDAHFGVREWAWLAVREDLAADLVLSIGVLSAWTTDPSERLRRFASEALRPRGVWCAHIQALKEQPELALPILEALRADSAAYVQNSIGNWLNDASKDRPDWVRTLCARWMLESPTAATARICKRALRTVAKKPSM